ncbi:MAG: DUF507 family protein [Desulfobacteraceae bacterium]|nr:MAG: DUF507 family protein [Desulfobacteraceae bacterium]
MRRFDSGKVQNQLLNQLERQEKNVAFQRDRFLKFKLPEICNRLGQALLMDKVIEMENPAGLNALLEQGLQKLLRLSEFDYKYFVAPLRDLIAKPNPISLFITQYILETVIQDPAVVDIFGTDQEIYKVVNKVISQINQKFEKAEEEILEQLSHNKTLTAGSREYDIALDQLVRKKLGEPQKM